MSDAEQKVILRARDLVAEIGWTPHLYAIDDRGKSVDPSDPFVARVGILGALLIASREHERPGVPLLMLYTLSRQFLRETLGVKSIAEWEDTRDRTQAEVLTALERAAESAAEDIIAWEDPLDRAKLQDESS